MPYLWVKRKGLFMLVIFDLDGTLVNSLQDLAESANAAVAKMGFPTHSIEEVKSYVGNGVRLLIARALPLGTSDDDVERCLGYFREIYDAHLLTHTCAYPGVTDMLKKLSAEGIKVAILSNKYDKAVKEIASCLFPDSVHLALGESESVPRKPNPTGVRTIMDAFKASVADTYYVGDSDVDMQTAKNAGVESIGVLWGFRSRQVLKEAGAHHIVTTADELTNLLLSFK